ncbi:MAG: hypothetical protein ACOYYS_23670 [Chloroflexota bacterium]
MNYRFRYFLIIGALVLVTLACSLMPGDSTPNPPAADGGNSSDSVLFQDDFSSTGSGWDRIDNEDGITDYADGGYRIFVPTADTELWANPGLDFGDVRIEVDALRQAGPEDNDFGVICRYQDVDNFYYLLVTSDGYFGIFKVKDGEASLLGGSESMGTSSKINAGSETNHLRADCVGSTLTLYANGQKLDSQEDSDFATGDVGLIAGTYTEAGTDIWFDNFTVLVP